MSDRLRKIGKTLLFFALPLLVFGWTSVSGPAQFTLHLALVVLLVVVGLAFVKKAPLQFPKTVLHTLLVLLLVGGTGWFLSPFFFLLYLLPIYLGFLYVPSVAFGFLAALIVIFAFSVGEVDVAFDIMTLLSLLLAIPLIMYLRRQYLVIRQTTKDILILEDEGSGIKDLDTISHLLANRVTRLGVALRDPMTFVRQAAITLKETPGMPDQAQELLDRVRLTAAKTLEQIRAFEGDTSEHQVLTNRVSAKTINLPGRKKS